MRFFVFIIVFILLSIIGYLSFDKVGKLLPILSQLEHERVGTEQNLQPLEQRNAEYVGSGKCMECHGEQYDKWSHSLHPKMLQNINKNPSAVVADFSKLPKDANFKLEDATYTVGNKFKQRYMIRKDKNGAEDYFLGNYQWNIETKKWQGYKPWGDWYKDGYNHDNKELPTSRTCDGCHFVGFMSKEERTESGIACESCHGPGSNHVKEPKSEIFKASLVDSKRQNEVCLQCHMRNRDMRLQDQNISDIFGDVRDYPYGYEPGKPLVEYKFPAPFTMGVETKEFYANGAAKKNRTQGNEFVHSMKGHYGITCINCHDPHSLTPTAQNNSGNDLCMKCHSFNSVIGPHQSSLEKHTHHKADSKGSQCVECHMPKTAKHTKKSPFSVRSHLFGFTTPNETIKYKMPYETNACYACHKDDRSMSTLQKDLESWGMVGFDKR